MCSSAQHGLKLDTMDHIAVGHIGLAKEETVTATKFCFFINGGNKLRN